jgi:GTP cyclohydrolase II
MVNHIFDNTADNTLPTGQQLNVRRRADDLRAGVPVIITAKNEQNGSFDDGLLFIPSETLSDPLFNLFYDLNKATPFIILSPTRAETLHIATKGDAAVLIKIPYNEPGNNWGAREVRHLGDPVEDLDHPFRGPFNKVTLSNPNHKTLTTTALSLAKEARLLPAGLALELSHEDIAAVQEAIGVLSIPVDAIMDQRSKAKGCLSMVSHAKVPLLDAEETSVYMFRPSDGGAEHLAIIIGEIDYDTPVLTRLHSECFTGDLLGSLKCDCGDQLKGAIEALNKNGGGVLLYLAQEGRGIGLPAKLKAYALQDQGFDTVDANLRLGFGVDERIYGPALSMLKYLNIKEVRLMTNNPKKVEGLSGEDIKVVERVAHHFPTNQHNEQYLDTKKTRTGHLL